MQKHTHLGIYGVVVNDDKILLIKKARGPYKGKFDLPGGSVEFGETPEQTLSREIKEETGLDVIKSEILYGESICFPHNFTEDNSIQLLHHIGFIYKVECPNYDYIKTYGDDLDSNGCLWFNPYESTLDNLTPFAKKIIEKLFT